GPKSDPAGIKGMTDIAKALETIKEKGATFISRGDNSGTHMFELALWNKDVGINIQEQAGAWYKSVGRGMGATLYKALVHNGYTVSDRGTWIHFQKQGDLEIMVEGDKRLFKSIRRHSGEPGQVSECEERPRTAVHRLAGVAGGPEGHRRLQDQRRAVVFSERKRSQRVKAYRCRDSRAAPMSALGQKHTFAPQKAMSASPRIATAKADSGKRSCLLYPKSGHVQCSTRCLLRANSRHPQR